MDCDSDVDDDLLATPQDLVKANAGPENPNQVRKKEILTQICFDPDFVCSNIIIQFNFQMEVEVLAEELMKSQALTGRLDVENKYLMLRLRHQLKESEATSKKVKELSLQFLVYSRVY